MKIDLKHVETPEEESAVISVVNVTDSIRGAIDLLENQCATIPVQHDDKTMMCRIDQIYYIESVDKRSFVYTKAGCYETKYRLYELEEMLRGRTFLRVQKGVLLNLMKIRSIKPALGGRYTALLKNEEEVVISRKYVADLKKALKGGE